MTPSDKIDLLFVISVANEQAGELSQRLVRAGFYFTRVDSSGGLLEKPTVSLLVGIPAARREALMQVVRACCAKRRTYILARTEQPLIQGQPLMIEAEIGGATISVLEVEHFEQF